MQRPAGYFKNSLRYLFARHIERKEYLVADSRVRGLSFRFKTEDSVGRHIFKMGTYEEALTGWLEDNIHLGANDCAIDVGANLGWFSALLDRLSDDGARVLAFEPDPVNHGLLLDNLHRNGARCVTPIQKALGAEASLLQLHRYAEKNLGRHSLLPINGGPSVEVEVVALDAFLEQAEMDPRRVRFVKLDVEGYELPVLRGMPRLLAEGPVLAAEFSPVTMRRCGLDVGELLGLLSRAGYQAHRFEKRRPVAVPTEILQSLDHTEDLLWLRT